MKVISKVFRKGTDIISYNYLLFIWYLFIYYNSKGDLYRKKVTINNVNLEIIHGPSFLWQFKDIFVDESLRFYSETDAQIIYDCGSNIGMSIVYFKKLFPDAKIKAFEADASIADVSRKNILNNNIHGVDIISKAVWINYDGVEFVLDGADGGSMYSEGNKVAVPSIRLKDLLQKEDKVDMLKIDIEGSETEVIEDCKSEFSKVDNIFVEYHSWHGAKQGLSRILRVLEESNFRYYMTTVNKRIRPFLYKRESGSMDLQINIYATRENK